LSDGSKIAADRQLVGGPSVLFDTVVLAVSDAGVSAMLREAAAIAWVNDAFAHLKVIGLTKAGQPFLDKAGVIPDAGLVPLAKANDATGYIGTAAKGRLWSREPSVRDVY
jgi:catalase